MDTYPCHEWTYMILIYTFLYYDILLLCMQYGNVSMQDRNNSKGEQIYLYVMLKEAI